MNRLKVVGMLVTLGSIAIVTALTRPTVRADSPAESWRDSADHTGHLIPSAGLTCTLAITTTDLMPGNQSFATAFLLSSASGLSLVPSTFVPPGTVVDVATQDDYFYLNSLANSTIYHLIVTPAGAGNYNLGLDVYDETFNLIFSDANPLDDYSASITFAPAYTGRVYFRVYQLTPFCSGGNYSVQVTYQTPTPTPTPVPTPSFGYGVVMAGPDNLWPQWIDFNYQLVFNPPVFSGRNELMRLSVDISDLGNLFALKGRLRQIVHDNDSVESFQIGNEPNLSSEWNAPPDALSYRTVLCAAYQAIKQVRPSAVVVSGGLAPTGRVVGTWNGHLGHDGLKQDEREFLKEFIDDGGGNCLDAVGYNSLGFRANYAAAPDVDGGTPDTNCASGLCFRSIEQAHAIMQSRGLYKPIWATEVGWLVAPPSYCLSDPRWQGRTWQIVTPAQQANNLVGAFQYARLHWPWLKAMFVFNLDFNLAPWYDECEQMRYYSVVGQPAFAALGRMPKEVYRLYLPVMIK